jgi:hypothetical protein
MSIADARRRERVSEADLAVALLGSSHPLVTALERVGIASQQCQVLACATLAAVAGLALGMPGSLAVLAAASVSTAAFVFARTILLTALRDRSVHAVATGNPVTLPTVDRERRRLRDPEHHKHLAAWLEEIADGRAGAASLVSASVIAAAIPELTAAASGLRQPNPAPRGVAMAERLLVDGGSSLYGPDPQVLRSDLSRIRTTLAV